MVVIGLDLFSDIFTPCKMLRTHLKGVDYLRSHLICKLVQLTYFLRSIFYLSEELSIVLF